MHVSEESGIVLLLGVEPVTDAVWLEVGFSEQAAEVSGRDRLDDAASDDFPGQFGMSPVGEGEAQLLGIFAGRSEDQGQLFGSELARRASAGARINSKYAAALMGDPSVP